MGDINTHKIFYQPAPSYGGLVYFHFNTRYSLKGTFYKGKVSGSDLDFSNEYQRLLRKSSFSSSIFDIAAQIEFNFLPYSNASKFKDNFTFFVTSGFGYTFLFNSSQNAEDHVSIPIGCGFKYNLVRRVTLGTEWTYRKTFSDNVDGVVNWKDSFYRSNVHNFDWYSFFGIFLTYKIYSPDDNCPVYWSN